MIIIIFIFKLQFYDFQLRMCLIGMGNEWFYKQLRVGGERVQ